MSSARMRTTFGRAGAAGDDFAGASVISNSNAGRNRIRIISPGHREWTRRGRRSRGMYDQPRHTHQRESDHAGPPGEREAWHARLDAHKDARRPGDEIPLSVGGGILFPRERA